MAGGTFGDLIMSEIMNNIRLRENRVYVVGHVRGTLRKRPRKFSGLL